jgi:ribose-phosphate pyrophosphokinase
LYLSDGVLGSDKIFNNLDYLDYLDLSHNSITTLPDGIFNNLIKLTRLDLTHNSITILSDKIFTILGERMPEILIDSEMNKLIIEKFKDGEILPRFKESVRDEDIFFIQSTDSSDNIMETLLVIDAAKRSGCKSFCLISPFQGYSRQDKCDHVRSSIGSKVISDILEKVGMKRLITIDLHASSIQGFYNTSVIHLNGNKIFINYLKSLNIDNLTICAPDHGALKKNADLWKFFPEASLAIINKKRIKPNEIHSMELIGDVRGRNIFLMDDMTDTAGTLCKASELLINTGALSVRAITTHPILSGDALDNISKSSLTEVIVSDTIGSVYDKQPLCEKIKIITCADLISDSIYRLFKNKSIHELNN